MERLGQVIIHVFQSEIHSCNPKNLIPAWIICIYAEKLWKWKFIASNWIWKEHMAIYIELVNIRIHTWHATELLIDCQLTGNIRFNWLFYQNEHLSLKVKFQKEYVSPAMLAREIRVMVMS